MLNQITQSQQNIQEKFNTLLKKHNVKIPLNNIMLTTFNTFETKSPTAHLFFRDVKQMFKKKSFIESGVCEYLKTRKYYSMWDKHYNEIIILHLPDYDIRLTRKYTYANTYGRKYHETDTLERIDPK